MSDEQAIFYWIGVSVSVCAGIAIVIALSVVILDRAWRLWKDASGFVQLMWAWHLHKNAAREKAEENKGRLP